LVKVENVVLVCFVNEAERSRRGRVLGRRVDPTLAAPVHVEDLRLVGSRDAEGSDSKTEKPAPAYFFAGN